jgi:glycosyltransferase involved in cell wall biosynthesis
VSDAPLVTIGLPVYNSKRYVRQSLDSLLAQTYRNFTLIVNDNASTDGTPRILEEYAARDPRVKCFRNETNIGNPRNFNRVFELTTTPYLKWSTADDFWEPTFLERAMEVMERDPTIALCYPKTYIVDAEGGNRRPVEDRLHLVQPDPADRFIGLLTNIGLAHQHLGVIRTACLRRTHLLGVHVASDVNLLAELTLYGKFYELPERLFYRRFHKTSGSWKRDDPAHQAKHYHGTIRRDTKMTTWRCHTRFFSAVAASPLPRRSKLRLWRYLLRRMVWDRRDLLGELSYKLGTR